MCNFLTNNEGGGARDEAMRDVEEGRGRGIGGGGNEKRVRKQR